MRRVSRRLTPERLVPRTLLALAALALAGVLLALWSGPADAQTTFTVNKTGDAKDRKVGNGKCDSSRKRGLQCTLRAAIEEANATPGADTINFKIRGDGVKTISPASPLPAITDPVTIDGYSQPGASANTLAEGNDAVLLIQLNGTNAGAGASGLTITAADSTIKGLVINRFKQNGILIDGAGATENNKVLGNFIGTDKDGTEDLGNTGDGVHIKDASNNFVGARPAGRPTSSPATKTASRSLALRR